MTGPIGIRRLPVCLFFVLIAALSGRFSSSTKLAGLGLVGQAG